VDGLLRVLVAAVVSEPYVVALLGENKGQAALLVGETDPDLAARRERKQAREYGHGAPVHEEPMVEIHDRLSRALPGHGLLALLCRDAVKAEKVAVLGENDVRLGNVTTELAEFVKVLGVPNRVRLCVRGGLWFGGVLEEDEAVEGEAREVVEPLHERLWEEEDDKAEQRLERVRKHTEEDGKVLARSQPADERDRHSCSSRGTVRAVVAFRTLRLLPVGRSLSRPPSCASRRS
jgi:hypothetical protein